VDLNGLTVGSVGGLSDEQDRVVIRFERRVAIEAKRTRKRTTTNLPVGVSIWNIFHDKVTTMTMNGVPFRAKLLEVLVKIEQLA
jgi:hypothetical protein